MHPDDRDYVNTTYLDSVQKKEPYGPITHRLLMKGGNIKFVEERGNTIYNDQGEPIRSYGVVQDITERVLGEKTKAQLKEKEILLKEIYHRVKNNLQLVSSLISIQSSKINNDEIKELFETSRSRINAISIVHEHLCNSENLATIRIDKYIDVLVKNFNVTNNGDPVNYSLNITDAIVAMDVAVPLGLILNEILSNSLKYAFSNGDGEISIMVSKSIDEWKMIVADNGVGVENVEDLKKSNSFGYEIIQDLINQLEGNIEVISAPNEGVTYKITFPK